MNKYKFGDKVHIKPLNLDGRILCCTLKIINGVECTCKYVVETLIKGVPHIAGDVDEDDLELIEYAAKAGADRVELYTEPYATLYPKNPEAAIAPFVEAAKAVRSMGMGLNAGHDLSLVNLKYMHDNIPWLDEVSIGHALISDALYLGLEKTIEEYKNCLR